MKPIRILFVLFLLYLNLSLSAWSKEGHHIVCAIMQQYINPQARDSVQHYLGDMTLEEASVWMDEARRQPGHAYLNTWHYVNIEKDKTYVEDKKPNIINRLQLAIYNLKNKLGDYQTKHFNLKVLIHLIGDLHQPLHIAYAADRGGNDTKVKYFERESNLHKVWDDQIIKSAKIDFDMCMKLSKTLPAFKAEKYEESMVLNWAMESRLLLENVYDVKDNYISHAYLNRNAILIELQLLKAGRRLAGLLNALYAV